MAEDQERDGWAGLNQAPKRNPSKTARQMAAPPGNRVRKAISEVGDQTAGGLACPKCGGTQFKAKRSRLAKTVTVVSIVGVVAMPKRWVKCVTCGTEYQRG